MNITQAIKMSAKSIFSNKARSALTMLGIIIGLAAVIVLVSYAQGQNMAMQRYYESMGTNKISVSAYDWTGGTDISQSLYDYCLNLSDQVVGFSPTGTVNSAPPIKFGSKTLAQDTNGGGAIIMGGGMAVSGDRGSNYPTLYLGNNQFGQCNDYTIAKGRDLSYLDVKNSSKVCVLGAATADYLFNFANPIDQIITISGTPFRVVGVYSYKGDRSSSASGTEDDQWINQMISGMDKMILLPSTMNRIFNENEPISDYVVKVRSSEDLRPVITGLKGFLSGVIDSNNGFYSVDSNDVYKEQQGDATKMQQNFLGGIAAISLLVGGIGIMNIMLVSVTERTREIGLRMSIGAKGRDILAQFLIESILISVTGGVIGILVGVGAAVLVNIFAAFPIYIQPWSVFLSFAVCTLTGIFFGWYPAQKAAMLNPIDALRYE